MNQSPGQLKGWTLTEASFEQLLSHLSADRDAAAELYELNRQKLIKFFSYHRTSDPETDADETINRVARKIAGGEEIQNISAYLLGVARFYLKEVARKNVRQETIKRDLSNNNYVLPESETETENKLQNCFESCLQILPDDERLLITGYYEEEKSLKIERRRVLSDKLGIGSNALRIRAHRIRGKLEKCVNNCLQREQKK